MDSKEITLLKKKAASIQKKYPHVSLTEARNDLAKYLGFTGWIQVKHAGSDKINAQLKKHPLDVL